MVSLKTVLFAALEIISLGLLIAGSIYIYSNLRYFEISNLECIWEKREEVRLRSDNSRKVETSISKICNNKHKMYPYVPTKDVNGYLCLHPSLMGVINSDSNSDSDSESKGELVKNTGVSPIPDITNTIIDYSEHGSKIKHPKELQHELANHSFYWYTLGSLLLIFPFITRIPSFLLQLRNRALHRGFMGNNKTFNTLMLFWINIIPIWAIFYAINVLTMQFGVCVEVGAGEYWVRKIRFWRYMSSALMLFCVVATLLQCLNILVQSTATRTVDLLNLNIRNKCQNTLHWILTIFVTFPMIILLGISLVSILAILFSQYSSFTITHHIYLWYIVITFKQYIFLFISELLAKVAPYLPFVDQD